MRVPDADAGCAAMGIEAVRPEAVLVDLFARAIVAARFPIILAWVIAAMVMALALPTLREAQTGALAQLVPADSRALEAEKLSSRNPGRWARSCSVRSRSPCTPYMIWTRSSPRWPLASVIHRNSRFASSGHAAIQSERMVRLRSRSQAKR